MKRKILIPLLAAVLAVLAAGCGADKSSGHPFQEEPGAVEPLTAGNAEELLAKMSTEQKVGQLFLVRPEALDLTLTPQQREHPLTDGLTEATAQVRTTLADYPVGGFLFFGKNFTDAEQLTKMMGGLTSSLEVPPLFAVEEEGGSVARVANSGKFGVATVHDMKVIGDSGDPAQARTAAATIGTYLKDLGFHLTLAPVADVLTDSKNIDLVGRAFSDNPETVSMMISAAVEGFHAGGVGCTLKHFPGQGEADLSAGSGATEKTWDEMLTCEIYPFQAGMAGGADAVMVSHIATPNAVANGQLPASLNPAMVTGKLREELNFQRVVITDSLSMSAITDNYSADQAALLAFQAGADILLLPEDLPAAYDAILTAVQDGTITQQRLDESVLRILQLKEKYGLI